MSKKPNIEKIKAKIAALLAKAGGTDNAHEAETFAAKAQQMLEEYQLEIGDLVKSDPIERTVIMVGPKTQRQWHKLLPTIVCRYYGCKCIAWHEQNIIAYTAVGRESARVTAALMFPFLVDQLRAKALEYQKITLFGRKKAMNDIVDAFTHRLQELIAASEKVAGAAGGHSRALVQVDEADAWMKANIEGLKEGGKPIELNGINDHSARLAGEISLARQMDGGEETMMQLEHQA